MEEVQKMNLDFNGDGKVDTGEQFVGYQIFQDVIGQRQSAPVHRKLDGFEIFLLILFAYWILNTIAGWLY